MEVDQGEKRRKQARSEPDLASIAPYKRTIISDPSDQIGGQKLNPSGGEEERSTNVKEKAMEGRNKHKVGRENKRTKRKKERTKNWKGELPPIAGEHYSLAKNLANVLKNEIYLVYFK
ncbi:unnamed protein product [Linum trigynum]|uniref:Uncharacterized protein n=1 Tax=Linum trigynum TaxID=586398 RepID=A0AAV2GVR9_9ROSI